MSESVALPQLSPAPAPGRTASAVLTVAVHLLLAIFLIYGIRWQTHTPPEAVEVELVRAVPAVPPPPVPEVQPTPEPRPQPRVEAPPPPAPAKPDIAMKEKVKPPKPAPKPVPKPDAFQQELAKEQERLDQAKAANAAAKELAQLKAAQAKAQAAQAASARTKALASYEGKIRQKIKGNIVPPPDLRGNPEAVFDVTQLPTGEVLAVRLKKSSGNSALDAAIERAIYKSSPLPKPDSPDLFERELELKFRPLEE